MVPQTCFLNLPFVGIAVPMADVAMYTIKYIKRLLTHVSNKVKSDFFRILVDYSQAKGTLIAFYLEPITTRLLELIDDEEFNQDAFLTYHLSMPNPHLPRQNLFSKTLRWQATYLRLG